MAVHAACNILHVARSAYYKWRKEEPSPREAENREITKVIEQIHMESPDKGYRRIRDDLRRYYQFPVNDKRVLRLCRKSGIQSTIKYKNQGCTRRAKEPQYVAENILNGDFHAEKPDEKWVTDVSEFRYVSDEWIHKLYLSAILDLCDKRVVSFVIRDRNDVELVNLTFDQAVEANPDAHPLFHDDRGFQYTRREFHQKLVDAGMTHSMSRVAHCQDNGPMEGFWGILKRERYYGHRFTSREALIQMIVEYIEYYNTRRLQRKLGILTPFEKHAQYALAA